MHILFTSAWFPNRNSPQNGDFVQRHAKAVATKHKVTVLHVEGCSNIAQQEISFFQVGNYEERVVYIPKSTSKLINGWRKFRIYNKIANQLRPYDLIHTNILSTHTLWVLYRRLRHGERFVLSEHWTRYSKENHQQGRGFWIWVAAGIAKHAAFIVPVSRSLQEGLEALGIRSRFEVVPNVIDMNVFNANGRITSAVPHFLHVSSCKDAHKNVTGMLRVVEKLHAEKYHFTFTIAGSEQPIDLQNLIRERNLTEVVEILGSLAHCDVAALMKKATCFVLFSNYENQPCVISEAYACGLPVIATKVGGIPEFSPPNFGFLIDKGNETQLYQAMLQTIEGHQFETAQDISAYAKRTFSVQVIAEAFENIYQKAVTT